MSRPYFKSGIVELEKLFAANSDKPQVLENLDEELGHRNTKRAERLREKVKKAIGDRVANPAPAPQNPQPSRHEVEPLPTSKSELTPESKEPAFRPKQSNLPQDQIGRSWEESIKRDFPLPDEPRSQRPVSNRPADILSAWLAWEVLSPQTYRHPKDLADDDRRRVADFADSSLPWEGKLENARPNTRLYYQVILGAVRMDRATRLLLRAFGDPRPERPEPRDFAALAIVTTDREGKPVEDGPVTISSFGWALPFACRRNLSALENWPEHESELTRRLSDELRRYDDNGELLPLSKSVIRDAFDRHRTRLGMPDYLVVEPSFAIRTYQWKVLWDAPEPTLLNSFYLNDLVSARRSHEEGKLGVALRRYLGEERPKSTVDFLRDEQALEKMLAPVAAPLGRWPSSHSLVLLQQAAVNTAFSELQQGGIMGINGPPGSGKTTLLRDVVAAVIVERAREIAKFDDPQKAFHHAGQIKVAQSFCHLYRVSEAVRGHEIVVASSNNKAVENISRELPERCQIAADDLSYFKSVSDTLGGDSGQGDTWGLIAAVLGNAANRSHFRKTVWKEADTSLNNYFRAASGSPVQPIEEVNSETGETVERIPHVVELENPPDGHTAALRRWRSARKSFLDAIADAETDLERLENARVKLHDLDRLNKNRLEIEDRIQRISEQHAIKGEERAHTESELKKADGLNRSASRAVSDHRAQRPGFFSRLFSTARWKEWKKRERQLVGTSKRLKEGLGGWQRSYQAVTREIGRLHEENENAQSEYSKARATLEQAENYLRMIREELGPAFADEEFWVQDHKPRQKSIPWLAKATQEKRDEVFKAAIRLQRAFLDVCAKQVRHNLMALFQTFLGKKLGTPEKEALLPDLWATLFLVTPVISTTFASVERMLGRLPIESLGWLLIDEAGQAIPQAAVGAMMRSRRVAVVGDPRQIEPVVTLADSLVAAIARDLGVEPDLWAVGASAQTLADSASAYRSEIEDELGSVTIGAPLLVHRRCEEPMFSISNRIAYAGQMVQATPERHSEIREALGPSRWIDVHGTGSSKWCAEEGRIVFEMLKALTKGGIENPDIFIITPFRDVRRNMIDLCLKEREFLSRWTSDPWGWATERVGTVHTFQGKEAEAVVFLLGAQNEDQHGARQWAGSKPNLLNVAATRAKSALYVVGNRQRWKSAGCFSVLDQRMP